MTHQATDTMAFGSGEFTLWIWKHRSNSAASAERGDVQVATGDVRELVNGCSGGGDGISNNNNNNHNYNVDEDDVNNSGKEASWRASLEEVANGPPNDIMSMLGMFGLAEDLEPDVSLMVFRRGIAPMWEHPTNTDGGRWRITVNENSLSILFIRTLSALFSEPVWASVSGIVVKRRTKGGCLDVWCSKGDVATVEDVGLAWQRLLQIWQGSLAFRLHKGATELFIKWDVNMERSRNEYSATAVQARYRRRVPMDSH